MSLKRQLLSAKTIAAVERLARSDPRLAATVDQWDRDPWLLNTPAGTIELQTGRMREHRREDYITKIAAVGPGGDCTRWRAFLSRVTAGNGELAAFIQRMLGYSLTGLTQDHAVFFCHGGGANGKTVLLSTVAGILGDYHTTAPIETFTASVTDRIEAVVLNAAPAPYLRPGVADISGKHGGLAVRRELPHDVAGNIGE